MKHKHTHGTWETDSANPLLIYSMDGGKSIGEAYQFSQTPYSEAEANAALISAAPELLEALEALSRCLPWCSDPEVHNCKVLALKAINKAKGL